MDKTEIFFVGMIALVIYGVSPESRAVISVMLFLGGYWIGDMLGAEREKQRAEERQTAEMKARVRHLEATVTPEKLAAMDYEQLRTLVIYGLPPEVFAVQRPIDDPLRLAAEKHIEPEVQGTLRTQGSVAPESISGRQKSQLTDNQWAQLRAFNELVKTARLELIDSLQSDLMSDSSSAVLAVKNAADSLDLPSEMAQDLRRLAGEAWTGIIMGVGVYSRAGKAIGAMGEIQERIESASSASGRNI